MIKNKIHKIIQFVYSLYLRPSFLQCHSSVRFERLALLCGQKYISISSGTSIQRNVFLTAWDSYGSQAFSPKIIIGKNCNIGAYNHISCINKIIIGDNFLSGKWVTIVDNSHGNTEDALFECPSLRNLLSKGPIVIGKNVWLGDKVTILPGVTIGDGVVVGANSVVTKDIPAYSVACGNPAKVVKTLSF